MWSESSHVVCCGTIRFSWSLFGVLFLWKATKPQRKTTSSQSHQLIQTRVNKVCRCENALKEADSLHFSESGERNMPDYFLLGDYFCVFPFVFFVINRPSLNLIISIFCILHVFKTVPLCKSICVWRLAAKKISCGKTQKLKVLKRKKDIRRSPRCILFLYLLASFIFLL